MTAKNKEKQEVHTGYSSFITGLSKNVGISLSSSIKNKDKVFNPYSAENQSQVQKIYDIMNTYKEKSSENSINIPKTVTKNKSKSISFEFEKELNADIINDIIDSKNLTDTNLDENSKIIEISNKK